MSASKPLLMLLVASVLFCQQVQADQKSLAMLSGLPSQESWTVIDTRNRSTCIKETLQGAVCFSSEELIDNTGRLPSFKKIAWLLGTYGLSGEETLLVTGNSKQEKHFIAGILYLMGQKQVMIVARELDTLLKEHHTGGGRSRAQNRMAIYTANPRQQHMLFKTELKAMLSEGVHMRILDARSEDEYWGKQVTGLRGGHIPGAEPWNFSLAALLRKAITASQTIIYANDPIGSIDAFVRLKLIQPGPVAVLINGWRSWASDPDMPVDAQVFGQIQNNIFNPRSNS